MPYRNRIIAIAFGLTLTFGALAQEAIEPALESEPVAEPRQEQSTPAGEQGPTPEQSGPSDLLPAIQGIEAAIRDLIPIEDATERERNEQRIIRDLNAQEEMALWAKAMFWTTLATVGLTALGVLLIWRTLHHTRIAAEHAGAAVYEAKEAARAASEANELQRELFISERRAWITIESVEPRSPLTWNAELKEGWLELSIRLKNTGATYAKRVLTSCEFNVDIKRLSADVYPEFAAKDRKIADVFGVTVFPGKEVLFQSRISISKDMIDAYVSYMREIDLANADPWTGPAPLFIKLYIRVDYRLAFGDTRHQTGVVFDVTREKGEDGSVALGPYWGDTPMESLRFRRDQVVDVAVS